MRLYEAARHVDRALFVDAPDPYLLGEALPIGYNATISEPRIAYVGLDLISEILEPGATVMDIGCGSGYTAAILAHLVGNRGRVIAIDHIPELVQLAKRNVVKLDKSLLNRITFIG